MKNCISCHEGTLKKDRFLFARSLKCDNCSGLFVRFKYLAQKKILAKKFDKVLKKASDSHLKCFDCGTTMKKFELGKIGLELDFCPKEYNIWFDVNEPELFVSWFTKHHKPKGPEPSINPQEPNHITVMAALYLLD